MSYPPDILNPDSLAEVLKQSCVTAVIDDPQGAGSIERLGTLVELLVMYIPLDQYTKVLDEWAAQPEGVDLPAAVKAVDNDQEEPVMRITVDKSLLDDIANNLLNTTMVSIGATFGKRAVESRDSRPCPKCGAAVGVWCKSNNPLGSKTIHRERLS